MNCSSGTGVARKECTCILAATCTAHHTAAGNTTNHSATCSGDSSDADHAAYTASALFSAECPVDITGTNHAICSATAANGYRAEVRENCHGDSCFDFYLCSDSHWICIFAKYLADGRVVRHWSRRFRCWALRDF